MDDKTKELLTQLKIYFDRMEASKESFGDVSRLVIMTTSQLGKIAAYLISPESAEQLLDAQTKIATGCLEISRLVKEVEELPVTATDTVT